MILRARKPKGTSCPMFLDFYSYFCNRKYHKDLAFRFLIKCTRLLSIDSLILHRYGFNYKFIQIDYIIRYMLQGKAFSL